MEPPKNGGPAAAAACLPPSLVACTLAAPALAPSLPPLSLGGDNARRREIIMGPAAFRRGGASGDKNRKSAGRHREVNSAAAAPYLSPSSLAPFQIGIFYRRRSILPFTAARALQEEGKVAVLYLARLCYDH